MDADPRSTIDRSPMSPFQWTVVAIMIGLNALDGFDVLSISFAAPGIARQFGIARAAMGVILSMELVGMALGSLVLGRTADRVGRRLTILGCLGVMATGMAGAATANDVLVLSIWRLFTGIGIGGMLSATNAAVAEVASAARRPLCVVLMAAGYPLGTIVGGSVSAALLLSFDWHAIFYLGAAATLCFVPVVALGAPESIAFLMLRRPVDALERINHTLDRMGRAPIARLPATPEPAATPLAALFASPFARPTIALTLAYLAHVVTFYFILKWIPKVVVDLGLAPSSAAGILVWASAGGLAGSLLLGLLTARFGTRGLTIGAMLASTVAVVAFGRTDASHDALALAACLAGFATNAGIVGLYALVAETFPTALRASATGLVIGVGRGGAAMAPALAGTLFGVGIDLPVVAAIMATGSLIAAGALLTMSRKPPATAAIGLASAQGDR